MSTISCWDGEMVDPSRLGLNTKKGVEVQVCTSSPEFVEGHEKCAHQERLAHEKCLQSVGLGDDPVTKQSGIPLPGTLKFLHFNSLGQ
jgi:hypothetical protein